MTEQQETDSAPATVHEGLTQDVAAAELKTWHPRATRAYPDPRRPGGLPPGWRLEAHRVDRIDAPNVHLDSLWVIGLVRRETGGWLFVSHDLSPQGSLRTHTAQRTYLGPLAATVKDLLAVLDERQPHIPGIYVDVLRDCVVSAYNSNDPVEAAERILVALGGPITVVPSALAEP